MIDSCDFLQKLSAEFFYPGSLTMHDVRFQHKVTLTLLGIPPGIRGIYNGSEAMCKVAGIDLITAVCIRHFVAVNDVHDVKSKT